MMAAGWRLAGPAETGDVGSGSCTGERFTATKHNMQLQCHMAHSPDTDESLVGFLSGEAAWEPSAVATYALSQVLHALYRKSTTAGPSQPQPVQSLAIRPQ
mmetsp:Transcript_130869/g.326531  ORF Transcript_130869/g.326531 Transcript_130869/m.326531 type:complete len:101 (+) Transcript_130869:1579-1881(+)